MAYVARLAEFVSPASSARAEKVHSCGSTSHSRSRTERTIYRVCKSVFFGKSLESRLAFRSKKMSAASSTITADLLADPAVAWDFIRTSISDAANLLGELSSGLAPGSGFLESLSENASDSVNIQLSALSPASLGVIFSAGVVTSLSPCTLSVLPLTLGYIGASASGKSRHEAVVSSIAFCCGLATTLTGMGVAASLTGKALISGSDHIGGSFSTVSSYVGRGLPLGVSFVAVLMGLNLLQVVKLQLPSLRIGNIDTAQLGAFGRALPSTLQAYIAGMTFALVASPCTTPIRATLLSYVAASQDPVIGGSLLLVYTTGYIVPLLLAASFAGVLQQQVQSIRRISGWASSASGALLVGGGVYTLWIQLQAPTTLTAIAATDVSSAAMTLVEHCH